MIGAIAAAAMSVYLATTMPTAIGLYPIEEDLVTQGDISKAMKFCIGLRDYLRQDDPTARNECVLVEWQGTKATKSGGYHIMSREYVGNFVPILYIDKKESSQVECVSRRARNLDIYLGWSCQYVVRMEAN